MSIQIALIVSAPREMTLTAGRQEIEPAAGSMPEEDDPPFLNIGRTDGDEVHISGALIGDPEHLGASLSVSWYLPGEEEPEQARPVNLSEAKLIVGAAPRHKADQGWRWHYRLESRRQCREVNFYDGGFQPPFKASDLTIYLEHLINYNYDGYIVTHIDYVHKSASYIETEWDVPILESEGFLED